MFTSNRSYWLSADHNTFLIRDESQLRRHGKQPAASRMLRDGWVSMGNVGRRTLYEKTIPNGWTLRRICQNRKPDRHELELTNDHRTLSFPTWEWAEWDRERLVWVEGGRLCAARLGANTRYTISTAKSLTIR